MEANEKLLTELDFKEYGHGRWKFSRMLRMAFSHRAYRDADTTWFSKAVKEVVPNERFVFFYLHAPTNSNFCLQMLSDFELPNVTPDIRLVKPKTS